MVYRSELNNWRNGNISDLDRESLIRILRYFETAYDWGTDEAEELIIEDMEDEYI